MSSINLWKKSTKRGCPSVGYNNNLNEQMIRQAHFKIRTGCKFWYKNRSWKSPKKEDTKDDIPRLPNAYDGLNFSSATYQSCCLNWTVAYLIQVSRGQLRYLVRCERITSLASSAPRTVYSIPAVRYDANSILAPWCVTYRIPTIYLYLLHWHCNSHYIVLKIQFFHLQYILDGRSQEFMSLFRNIWDSTSASSLTTITASPTPVSASHHITI